MRPQRPESPMERFMYWEFYENELYPKCQYQVGKYYIDLAFPDRMIAVEYDGKEYHKDKKKDWKRTKFLMNEGWEVYRVELSDKFLKWQISHNGNIGIWCVNIYAAIGHLVDAVRNKPRLPRPENTKSPEPISNFILPAADRILNT